MNKRILTSIVAITMCTPAMADINKNASTATCDSATIGATSGDANLQAAWQANTINLDWYNGDTKQTSTTCQYDGSITLPSNPSPKTGYTFGGWKVRTSAAAAVVNVLSTLNASIDGTYFISRSNNNTRCTGATVNGDNYTWFGTNNGGSCSDSAFTGMTAGEWATEFSYGTLYGEASCQQTLDADMAYFLSNYKTAMSGGQGAVMQFISKYTAIAGQEKGAILADIFTRYGNGTITYDEALGEVFAKLLSSNDSKYNKNTTTGNYCFCRITGYTPLNENKQNVSSLWAFRISDSNCASNCTNDCASGVRSGSVLRAVLFGSVAQ